MERKNYSLGRKWFYPIIIVFISCMAGTIDTGLARWTIYAWLSISYILMVRSKYVTDPNDYWSRRKYDENN